MCVGNKRLIVIGYFRKCIPYSGLVARDIFGIARGDTSNENRFVKLFLKNLKEKVAAILKTDELLMYRNIHYISSYFVQKCAEGNYIIAYFPY